MSASETVVGQEFAGGSGQPVVIRNKRDVYSFVNERTRGSGKTRLLLIAALASLFLDSWDIAGFGAGVPSITRTFSLSGTEVGTLTSSIGVGAVLAAIAGGYLVDRIGRLRMFVLDMVLFVVAAIVGAAAPNLTVLIIARFLMGVGIGLDVPAALSMVAEHSNTAKKRTNVNQNMLWNYYSIMTSYILSWLLVNVGVGDSLWRWQVAAGGVIAVVIILVRFLNAEESAFWLASRGELHAAGKVLEKAYHVKILVESEPAPSHSRYSSYADIFRKPYLGRTVLATSINVFQSIVYFAVGFYLPVITGVLFQDPKFALLGVAAINVGGLIGSAMSARLANSVGLRRETIIGFALEVPILVFLGIGVSGGWLPPIVGACILGLFLIVHTFGPAQTGVSIAALSYPTQIRGQGTGFSYGLGRVGAVIGFFVFPVLLGTLGLGKTVGVLALAPLAGLLIALAIRWEPTGAEADMEG